MLGPIRLFVKDEFMQLARAVLSGLGQFIPLFGWFKFFTFNGYNITRTYINLIGRNKKAISQVASIYD